MFFVYDIPLGKVEHGLWIHHVGYPVQLGSEGGWVPVQVHALAEPLGLVVPLEVLEGLVGHAVVHERQTQDVEHLWRAQHHAQAVWDAAQDVVRPAGLPVFSVHLGAQEDVIQVGRQREQLFCKVRCRPWRHHLVPRLRYERPQLWDLVHPRLSFLFPFRFLFLVEWKNGRIGFLTLVPCFFNFTFIKYLILFLFLFHLSTQDVHLRRSACGGCWGRCRRSPSATRTSS